MYSRNIVIAASLAVLTLAAPTPGTAVSIPRALLPLHQY